MIDRLTIFGATGDLTARYLLPGLAALRAAGLLSERFTMTGSNVLRFGLEPESLALEFTGVGARVGELSPLTLAAEITPPELPAYGHLLFEVLNQNAALSIRGDEAEESWRVVTPVLEAWACDLVPLQEYPAGSDGPADART
jgi:glucose-6-phosphate 1-dehydrogenase